MRPQARRALPILVLALALLGWLALGSTRSPVEFEGGGLRQGEELPAGSAPELRGDSTRRPTPRADAFHPGAERVSTQGALAPRGEGPPPPPAPPVGRGRIRGRARMPADAQPETWVVVWQRISSADVVGAGRVLADGTFELDVPSRQDGYALSLRPHNGLWPRQDSAVLATAIRGHQQDVLLEPSELASFRVHVSGDPPPRTAVPVQVISHGHYLEVIPNLRLELAAGTNEVEATGLQVNVLYTVYVGPTADGRYGSWQGRPQPGERVEVTLERGGIIQGRIAATAGLTYTGAEVVLRSFQGAEVVVGVAADGSFEQLGLQPLVLWQVEARAMDAAGGRLKSAPENVNVGSEVTLHLVPVPR